MALIAAAAAGCGSTKESASGSTGTTSASTCAKSDLQFVDAGGTLTIGTDNPAFPQWFGALRTSRGRSATRGAARESAVAYAVAKQLGFSKSEVKWIHVPFNNS